MDRHRSRCVCDGQHHFLGSLILAYQIVGGPTGVRTDVAAPPCHGEVLFQEAIAHGAQGGLICPCLCQSSIVIAQRCLCDLEVEIVVPHGLAGHEVRHVVAYAAQGLGCGIRPHHLVPPRMVVVGELRLGVQSDAVALDHHGVGDIAGRGGPGAGVFHHHVGADAGAAVH